MSGLVAFGESKSISQWAKDSRCKCSSMTIARRIKSGMSAEEAITTEKHKQDEVINYKHPLYPRWYGMKTRCYNSNVETYVGVNIIVCKEWKDDFKAFYEWAITKEWKDKVLVRKDNILDFTPDNCEFIDMALISADNGRRAGIKTKGRKRSVETDAKIKATNLEKYGVEYPFQSKEILDKATQTSVEKYGSISDKSKSSIGKTKQGNLIKYGVEFPQQLQENREKSRQKTIDNGQANFYNGKTSDELAKELGLSRTGMNWRIRNYGMEAAISTKKYQTAIEGMIASLLDKYNIQYEMEKHIENCRADFVIDNHKLIIECDGLYWHSDIHKENNNYHKIKQDIYTKNGYSSLFFREDEIKDKLNIIESIILNKLHKSKKIFARKCTIVEIEPAIAKMFFMDNHLMGKGAGKVFGLKYEGELVTCIQIINKQDHIEISRFCNKIGLSVTGGFSKLLKAATLYFSPIKIVTFIDRRYGSGEYLKDMGFVKETEYLSFKWVKDDKVFNRMQFPGNSGYEAGCSKLWDCGQAKYVKAA